VSDLYLLSEEHFTTRYISRVLYFDLISYLSLKGINDGDIGPEMCYQDYQATADLIKSIWPEGLHSNPNGGDRRPSFYTDKGHRVIYTPRGKRLVFSVRIHSYSVISLVKTLLLKKQDD
jgi:hypothetical protein